MALPPDQVLQPRRVKLRSVNSIEKKTLLGVCITLFGSFTYVIFGLLSQYDQQYIPFNYLIFLQSIGGLAFALIFLHYQNFKWSSLWEEFHPVYFLRIIISLISMYAYIYGLKFVSVYNALVILNCCPFFIPFFRFIFFKKIIDKGIYFAITIAFFGIVLILSPDHQILYSSIFIIFLSMIFMTFSILLLEHQTNTNAELAILIYFLFGTIITGLTTFYPHASMQLSWSHVSLGFLSGLLFFLVQLSMIYAARYISTQLMAVYFILNLCLHCISLYFNEIKLHYSLILGTVLVIMGGLSVLYLEKSVKR